MLASRWVASLALLLVVLGSDPAAAQVFKIAIAGESAPDGNGQYQYFADPFVTSDGHVVFWASTEGGPYPPGFPPYGACFFRFAADGGQAQALLCEAQSVGLPDSDIWIEFSYLDVNRHGDLVFQGHYSNPPGLNDKSVFRYADGMLTRIATVGDVAGTGASSAVVGSISGVRINDAGTVLFLAGSLFQAPVGGAVSVLFPSASTLPDDPSSFSASVERIAISEDGDVVLALFAEEYSFPPPPQIRVVYLLESGVFTRLATEGAAVGSGVAGTFARPFTFEFSPSGELFADVTLNGGQLTREILRWNGTDWEPAVSVVPTATGSSLLGVSASTELLYAIVAPGPVWTTFERRGGVSTQIVTTGDPAPDSGGGVFRATGWGPALNFPVDALGQIAAARVSLTGGSGSTGIFAFGSQPSVPALPIAAWIALALGLAASARRKLRMRAQGTG